MTRDDIYEHLAQVYLGKKNNAKKESRQKLNAWLVINIFITFVIFTSSFYGLSAFLTRRSEFFHNKVIYALNNGPIRVKYDLAHPFPSVKTFSLAVPKMSISKYRALQFSMRGAEEGYPGIVRIELRNHKHETASVFVDNIRVEWKNFSIPLEKFEHISDWSSIEEVSFVLEAWNAEKEKGMILIDDVCFSG